MDAVSVEPPSGRQACLSLILKAIRRRRGLRSSEVARELGMALRSYQRFESGAMGLDIDQIRRVADVLSVDGWAIIFGVEMNSVEFALSCADNKAATAFLLALRRFNLKSGKDIARLDTRSLMLVFTRMLDEISVRAREHDADLEDWMFDATLNGDPDDDQA